MADSSLKNMTDTLDLEGTDYLFLEGTAGIGKTTCLKNLRKKGRKCVFNDFYECSKQNPIFKQKHFDEDVSAQYDLFQTLLILDNSVAGRVIFDRSPFASILYKYIMKCMKMDEYPSHEVVQRDISNMVTTYNWEMYDVSIIVCINTNVDDILKRMIQRNNGLDILDKKYVIIQNMVFEAFAMSMQLPIFDLAGMSFESFEKWVDTYPPCPRPYSYHELVKKEQRLIAMEKYYTMEHQMIKFEKKINMLSIENSNLKKRNESLMELLDLYKQKVEEYRKKNRLNSQVENFDQQYIKSTLSEPELHLSEAMSAKLYKEIFDKAKSNYQNETKSEDVPDTILPKIDSKNVPDIESIPKSEEVIDIPEDLPELVDSPKSAENPSAENPKDIFSKKMFDYFNFFNF